jgi:hypothetical protein
MNPHRRFWLTYGFTFGIFFITLAGAFVYLKDYFALSLTVVISLLITAIIAAWFKYLGVL